MVVKILQDDGWESDGSSIFLSKESDPESVWRHLVQFSHEDAPWHFDDNSFLDLVSMQGELDTLCWKLSFNPVN